MKKHINDIYNLAEGFSSNDLYRLASELETLAESKEEIEQKKEEQEVRNSDVKYAMKQNFGDIDGMLSKLSIIS